MNCLTCQNGDYKEGKATMPLYRDGKVVLVTDIPALVCDNCGEFMLTPEVSKILYDATNEMFDRGDINIAVSYEHLDKIPA